MFKIMCYQIGSWQQWDQGIQAGETWEQSLLSGKLPQMVEWILRCCVNRLWAWDGSPSLGHLSLRKLDLNFRRKLWQPGIWFSIFLSVYMWINCVLNDLILLCLIYKLHFPVREQIWCSYRIVLETRFGGNVKIKRMFILISKGQAY